MYYVKYGSSYVHNPETDDCIVLDLALTASENGFGYCDFTIYPNNPIYGSLVERDSNNPITVYDGNTLLFAGFIYELGREFYLNGKVKCKGDLAYLEETILRPYSTRQRGFGLKAPATASEYFAWLIAQHNAQVGATKQFVIGTNQANDLDAKIERDDSEFYRQNDGYPSVWNEVRTKLLDVIEGYIRIRYDGGIRYIDYLSEWTDTNTQTLQFGVNITDLTETDNSENVVSYIVPLGAQQSDTKYEYTNGYFVTSDTTPDSKKTYYVPSTNYSAIETPTSFSPDVEYFERADSDSSYTFSLTTDTTPVATKGYYIMPYEEGRAYTNAEIEKKAEHKFVVAFASDKLYYEQTGLASDTYTKTSDTVPNSAKTYYTSSSGYSQASLTKANHYVLTTDTTPVATKGYYYLQEQAGHTYTDDEIEKLAQHRFVTSFQAGYLYYEQTSIGKFTAGTTYYEYNSKNDQGGLSITVNGLANGLISGETEYYKLDDKIYYKPNYDKYGWIGTVCEDSSITKKDKLLKYGLKELKELVATKRTIEVKAIDMHLIDGTSNPIKLGEYVHIISTPHDFDRYMVCKSIDLDLSNPENSLYTFGDTIDTFTSTQKKLSTEVTEVQTTVTNISNATTEIQATASSAESKVETLTKKTVKEFIVEYAQSSSSTEAPVYGWSKIAPEWSEDAYVWQRIVTVYVDSESPASYSTPTCIQGANGKPGEAGANVVVLKFNEKPSYANATWERYAVTDTSVVWHSVLNASDVHKNDLVVVDGVISDQENLACQIYGKVTDVSGSTISTTTVSFISAIRIDGLTEFVNTKAQAAVGELETNLQNGSTIISGGCIETGTIDASKVTVSNLSANAITGGTIDASKVTVSNLSADAITGGTLDASKATISNLSADAITGGTIDASKVTIDNLVVGENVDMGTNATISWGQVTDKSIGGTNLVNCTDLTQYDESNFNFGNKQLITVADGKITHTAHSSGSSVYVYPKFEKQHTYTDLKAGDKITASCYIYSNTLANGSLKLYVGLKQTAGGSTTWKMLKAVDTGVTGLVFVTYTLETDVAQLTIDPETTNSTSGSVTFGNLKVEKGDVATDWSASPWDSITSEQVTQITKDTVTTTYIKGLNLEVGNEIKMGANATISWDNVSNKNIGGTNLIERAWYTGISPWTGTASAEKDTHNDVACWKVSHNLLYISGGKDNAFPNLTFEENTQYTFTIDMCNSCTNYNGMCFIFVYSDGSTHSINDYSGTGAFRHFKYTTEKDKTLSVIKTSYWYGGYTWFKNLKLEKGSVATDYSPAPSDIWSTEIGKNWIKTSELEAQNLKITGGSVQLTTNDKDDNYISLVNSSNGINYHSYVGTYGFAVSEINASTDTSDSGMEMWAEGLKGYGQRTFTDILSHYNNGYIGNTSDVKIGSSSSKVFLPEETVIGYEESSSILHDAYPFDYLECTSVVTHLRGSLKVTSKSNGWDAHAYTTMGFVDSCILEFTVNGTTGSAMYGLSYSPTSSANYANLNYAIYLANGTAYIYESGANKGFAQTYKTGDVFRIEIDAVNHTVSYSRAGDIDLVYDDPKIFGTNHDIDSSFYGKRLYFDSSFYGATDGVRNLKFYRSAVIEPHVLRLDGKTLGDMSNTTSNPRIIFSDFDTQKVAIAYTDYDSYRASKGLKVIDEDGSDAGNVWFEAQGKMYCNGGKEVLTMYEAGKASLGTLKTDMLASPNGYFVETYIGEYSNASLGTTSSSSDSDVLKAILKKICSDYSTRGSGVFKGKFNPNSIGIFEVYIYDTSAIDSSTGLPRYSYGYAYKYGGNFCSFGTQSCTYYFTSGLPAASHSHSEYAASNHTHSGYAASNHTHSGYAASNHTHSGYAASSHTHSGYAASSHTHSYLPLSGGTLTGQMIAATGEAKGIKLGACKIQAVNDTNGAVCFQGGHLRFGGDAYAYSKWAGLSYDYSKKYIYLGVADNTIFTSDTGAISGGSIYTPGVSNIYVGSGSSAKRVLTTADSVSGGGTTYTAGDGIDSQTLEDRDIIAVSPATTSKIGGIKVGSGLSVTALGVLSTASYSAVTLSLTSGSKTINVSGYKLLILKGRTHSSAAWQMLHVPIADITSSAQKYAVIDGSKYLIASLSISGTTVTITRTAADSTGSWATAYLV